MFKGSMPALVTPFRNGELDLDTLKQLVEWQIAEGSTGLVPVGTTGESPTLSHEEHETVVAEVVKAAAGRVPVIAGAGSNNTVEAIRFVEFAARIGADAALVVTPYYNKPTQRGWRNCAPSRARTQTWWITSTANPRSLRCSTTSPTTSHTGCRTSSRTTACT